MVGTFAKGTDCEGINNMDGRRYHVSEMIQWLYSMRAIPDSDQKDEIFYF